MRPSIVDIYLVEVSVKIQEETYSDLKNKENCLGLYNLYLYHKIRKILICQNMHKKFVAFNYLFSDF